MISGTGTLRQPRRSSAQANDFANPCRPDRIATAVAIAEGTQAAVLGRAEAEAVTIWPPPIPLHTLGTYLERSRPFTTVP